MRPGFPHLDREFLLPARASNIMQGNILTAPIS
jgi:hypothetical protein